MESLPAGRSSPELRMRRTSGAWRWVTHAVPALLSGLAAVVAPGCREVPPVLVEADIPVSRTVAFRFDEGRVGLTGEALPGQQEADMVRAVSRAATERFIAARATRVQPSGDGGIEGELGLHTGWRQEFWALPRDQYQRGYTLSPGDMLLWDPTPSGVVRQVGAGSIIPGIDDLFTGVITRVLEVPAAGLYRFTIDSDDGTIGTLQDLSRGLEEVRVLWYDWRNQALGEDMVQTQVHLEPGTYLLTVHYYEEWHHAGYSIEVSRAAPSDSIGGIGG